MNKKKWLIIGTSWISEAFLESLRFLGHEAVGIISRSLQTGQQFKEKNGIPHCYTIDNLEDIDIDYDCVYVGTPNSSHYDLAKFFINKNKDVLIEKIMTHDPLLTKELFELADKKEVRVMEAYAHLQPDKYSQWRHHSDQILRCNYMQLSSKIKSGTADSASTFRRDTFGGVMPDLAVYPLSIAIWINGPVKSVNVEKFSAYNNNVEIDVTYHLVHNNGSQTFSRVSKLEDGDNQVYLNDLIIDSHVSAGGEKYRMAKEIKIFLEGDYKFSREISLEVAKIVETVKQYCDVL